MKHPTFDANCAVCRGNAGEAEVLFENDLWLIRPGAGVPGWLIVHAQRHVAGIAHFNDTEAENFGPAFRHFEKLLEEVTGALRIYTCAMGESSPHFHCHLVPRYAEMHDNASGFDVFGLLRASPERKAAEAEETARLQQAYRQALIKAPPPVAGIGAMR